MSHEVLGLTGGEEYSFKVRALNIYGQGDFSTPISQRLSNIPNKPSMVTVTLVGTDVQIAWVAPDSNFSPINDYLVELMTHSGDWVTDLTNCDGGLEPNFSSLNCQIPMVDIAPLTSLTIDTLIRARVSAHNANGWSEPSEPNISGQVVHTVPLQMDPVSIDPVADVSNT